MQHINNNNKNTNNDNNTLHTTHTHIYKPHSPHAHRSKMHHKNVVSFFGIYQDKFGDTFIVTEYMSERDLLCFLRKEGNKVNWQQKLKMYAYSRENNRKPQQRQPQRQAQKNRNKTHTTSTTKALSSSTLHTNTTPHSRLAHALTHTPYIYIG